MTFDIAPKTFCQYVDDSHARFGSRNNATEFLNILNSQDPQIQYITEYENDIKGNAQFVQKMNLEPFTDLKTIMELGNITKAAKCFLHLSYKNTQLLFFVTVLFNKFMRQELRVFLKN